MDLGNEQELLNIYVQTLAKRDKLNKEETLTDKQTKQLNQLNQTIRELEKYKFIKCVPIELVNMLKGMI